MGSKLADRDGECNTARRRGHILRPLSPFTPAARPEFCYDPGNRERSEGSMFAIPRRYSHFVFGVIQSGLTSCIAAGIASLASLSTGHFLWNWLASWLVSWVAMAPLVLAAA